MTNISRYSCWIKSETIKYLLVSSSGRTIKIADFSLQNFSASIAVPKHSICSSSESRKLLSLESAVDITDSIDWSDAFRAAPASHFALCSLGSLSISFEKYILGFAFGSG